MTGDSSLVPASEMKKYVFLRQRQDMTREEFADYWREPHARLLTELPEFWTYAERYIQNHVPQDGPFANPRDWGGIVENWQTDAIHEGRSFASEPVYAQYVTPDEGNFLQSGESIGLVTRTHVHRNGASRTVKLLEPVEFKNGERVHGLAKWREDRLRAVRESDDADAVFIENRVEKGSAVTLTGEPVSPGYAAIGEYWFGDIAAARAFARATKAAELLQVEAVEISPP